MKRDTNWAAIKRLGVWLLTVAAVALLVDFLPALLLAGLMVLFYWLVF
jgi:hypothetical protein